MSGTRHSWSSSQDVSPGVSQHLSRSGSSSSIETCPNTKKQSLESLIDRSYFAHPAHSLSALRASHYADHSNINNICLHHFQLKYHHKGLEKVEDDKKKKPRYSLILEPEVIGLSNRLDNWNVSSSSFEDAPMFEHKVISFESRESLLINDEIKAKLHNPSFGASPRTHRDFQLPDWQLKIFELNGFNIQIELNHGAYGKVYRARHADRLVAIKVMQVERFSRNYWCNFIGRELKALSSLPKHDNVVEIYDIFKTSAVAVTDDCQEIGQGDLINIVMEYCSGRDMYDHLSHKAYIPEKFAMRWFTQLLSAVGHMHRNGIAHRDIKIENLLLDEDFVLKLTDFGYCCNVEYSGGECCQQCDAPLDDKTMADKACSLPEKRSYTPCGSYVYSSPELLRGESYLPTKNDVWACGVVLYLMLYGDYPEIRIDLAQIDQHGHYHYDLPSEPKVSAEAVATIRSILMMESRRPSIAQLMEQEWIQRAWLQTLDGAEYAELVQHLQRQQLPRVETEMFEVDESLQSLEF